MHFEVENFQLFKSKSIRWWKNGIAKGIIRLLIASECQKNIIAALHRFDAILVQSQIQTVELNPIHHLMK